MADLATFEQYYKLTDLLIAQSTKEQLAESLRLLALNVAHPIQAPFEPGQENTC